MRCGGIRVQAGIILALLPVLLVSGALSCRGGSTQSGKLRVTASFYPMAEFARQIGGDRVEVATLVAPGTEPHDYDPTPRDIAAVHDSGLFIYNGAGFEPWADKISQELRANGVVVVNASEGISLSTGDSGSEGAGRQGSPYYDPHVWLDPVLAAQEVDNIMKGLIEADPENRAYYEGNAEAYKNRLAALDSAFREGLADCDRRDIVTSHKAFKYLADRYGLTMAPISGLSPDEEPSPQKLAEVARFARDNNVDYIFFESLVSPKLSETIASEVGARTLVLNPLEGLTEADIAAGRDYISLQTENLDNLRLALGCK